MRKKNKWVIDNHTVTIRIPTKLFKELGRISVKKRISVNKVINILLQESLNSSVN